MNAQEARNMAKEKNTNAANSQYARAQESITKAAKSGLYECWLYERMLDDVRLKLTTEDYKVGTNQSERNEDMVLISWK